MNLLTGTFKYIARKIQDKNTDIFDHKKAQKYENSSADIYIKNNSKYLFNYMENNKRNKIRSAGISELEGKNYYEGSEKVWKRVSKYITGKTCLEIGPGPCGALLMWWWTKKRVFIEPLIEEYRKSQLKYFGKTWYTNDFLLFNKPAEEKIFSLVGKVDGAIVCRNTLDHCQDPMKILENISIYAKSGCYLLLWTDLWHLDGHDEGHTNITKDKKLFGKKIKSLGFKIEYAFDQLRNDNSTIDYGCRARKI